MPDSFCGFCGFLESAHGRGAGPYVCTRFTPRADARDLHGECPRCGQQSAGTFVICDRCRAGDRDDQGTQDHLFTPTAAPIPGQQTF